MCILGVHDIGKFDHTILVVCVLDVLLEVNPSILLEWFLLPWVNYLSCLGIIDGLKLQFLHPRWDCAMAQSSTCGCLRCF